MPQLPCEQTSVPVDKSIKEIRGYLEDMGATDFMYSTQLGSVREFRVGFKYDGIDFLLPAKLKMIENYLRQNYSKPADWYQKQAERIAGRQIKDQVRILFASAKLEMATVLELFQAFAMIQTKDGQYLRLGEIITSDVLKNNRLALPAPEGR